MSLLDVYLAPHACGVWCRFLMFTWLPMRVVSGAASWCNVCDVWLPGSQFVRCLVAWPPICVVSGCLAPHVCGVWLLGSPCVWCLVACLPMRVVSGYLTPHACSVWLPGSPCVWCLVNWLPMCVVFGYLAPHVCGVRLPGSPCVWCLVTWLSTPRVVSGCLAFHVYGV